MSLDENSQIFITESLELLDDMEAALLELERAPNDADLINRVFRGAHTIKGSAGLFGFDQIIAFTHVAENLLDDVRNCMVPVTDELISLLMRAKDFIALMIDGLQSGESTDPEEEKAILELLSAFKAGGSPIQTKAATATESDAESAESGETTESGNWHISLRMGKDTFREGFDPMVMFEQLRELGEIVHAQLVTEAIPPLSDLDPEDCYLGWEVVLKSTADKSEIADVFEFIDGVKLHILPPSSRAKDYLELIKLLPEDEAALGQILVNVGALTANELQLALNEQKQTGGLTGEILVEQKAVQPEVVNGALEKQQKVRAEKQRVFVRVDAQKLDKLVTLVGELVISGAKVSTLASNRDDDELIESVEDMTLALEDMRETALGLRMVPIANTFNRFHRVVRDTAKQLEKQIRLEIYGGDTELDKTVIERIGDPLTHLIRNSMDHGVELPHERLQAGKSEEAVIQLKAYHETGTIVIEINDDGRGLNAERIQQLAEERGLIQPDQSLSKKEIYNLIFEPGFSTAETVSDLSGRGVGMDVVRRNIESLRGSVTVNSIPGQGATVTIRLPLTLAIIDGFHVRVADESFVIPLDMMVECVTLNESQRIESMQHDYINLRDQVLPLINLRNYMDMNFQQEPDNQRINVVVVQFTGKKVGLLVDELHGETQAVIKPLGRVFQGVHGFAGFTILGSGHVALIMDIPDLIKTAAKQEQQIHTAGGQHDRKGSNNSGRLIH